MNKVNSKFQNIDELRAHFDIVLETSLNDFLSATKSRREDAVGSRRFMAVAFSFMVAIIIALYVIQDTGNSFVTNFLTGCAMVWLLLVLLAGRSWLKNDKLLAKEMNMALVPTLTNTLDRMLMYTHDTDHREETLKLLRKSELITSPDISIVSDDMYTIYGDKDISLRELVVTKKRQNGNGKGSHQVRVFKGLFVVTKLDKNHGAGTYISTDGDRIGFAHRTFWSDLTERGDVQETVLEWNDFEKHLHVASSDAVKAREILTPEFMEDLYDWWLEHKLNIRISFKDNYMFILLPESSIKIGTSTTSTRLEPIQRYAWSLVRPMWRSISLVEDVSS